MWIKIPEPKTKFRGARTQTARCDDVWIIRVCEKLFQSLSSQEHLWPASSHCYARRWKAIGAALGLCTTVAKGMTPASLRAGGVTTYFQCTEDIGRLIQRGRWTSHAQLATYVQEVGPWEFLASLSQARREYLEALASLLPAILEICFALIDQGVPTVEWYSIFQQAL